MDKWIILKILGCRQTYSRGFCFGAM